jgi:hypothetical protein
VSGPLAPYAAAYDRRLVGQGFAQPLRQFDDLSHLLEHKGLSTHEQTPQRAEQFGRAPRGRLRDVCVWIEHAALGYPREICVVPARGQCW